MLMSRNLFIKNAFLVNLMRYFIGIPLPLELSNKLLEAQQVFRKVDARMTLTKKNQFHITLHFLGDIDDVTKIKELLKEVKFNPFNVTIKNLSFFPKKGYIRVINSPVVNGSKNVKLIHQQIINLLSLDKDESFTPHVTLARVKFVKSTNALARVCNNIKFEASFKVNNFILYSSKLTPNGPIYKVVETYPK